MDKDRGRVSERDKEKVRDMNRIQRIRGRYSEKGRYCNMTGKDIEKEMIKSTGRDRDL